MTETNEPLLSREGNPLDRPTNVRFLILVLGCVTSFLLYAHRATWNFVAPELEQTYGYTKTETSLLYSCFSFTYGTLPIPLGVLCDSVGPYLFLGAIIFLWSIAMALQGWVTGIAGLGAVRVAFGAAQSGCYPALSKVTYSWFPPGSRTVMQGLIASFSGRVGGAVSPILLGTILMGYCGLTWQLALLMMAVVGIAFGVLFLWLFRDSPASDSRVNDAERHLIAEGRIPTASSAARAILPWSKALKNRSMILFLTQQALNAGVDTFYMAFLGDYFLNAKGYDIKSAGLLTSIPLWGGAIGGLMGGYCNDLLIRKTGSRRLGRSTVAFVGFFVGSLMIFLVSELDNGVAAACALFGAKLFIDTSQPTVWGTCTDLGGRFSATVLGIINTAGMVGGLTVPFLFGLILDANMLSKVVNGETIRIPNYQPVLIVIAVAYVLSACCWLFIDCSKSLDQDDASDQSHPTTDA
ncbi:MAG: MFS transporter [Planctomycetota bacterium]|nr:MFS transporter [Planctomycetota bacterium]MDA1213486.1 MFS transporter [Planctomycetota bacterium]